MATDLRSVGFMKRRILIVEDDPSALELLCALLEPTYEYETATTLSEARRRLACLPAFDSVVLDLRLPDGNGDVLIAEYRNRVGMVVLSAVNDIRRATRLMSEGAFYFLPKTASNDEILSAIAQSIEASDREKKNNSERADLGEISRQVSSLKNHIQEELWHYQNAVDLGATKNIPGRLKQIEKAFEKRIIFAELERRSWRKNETANFLGIHLNTLLLKIREYGISKTDVHSEKP